MCGDAELFDRGKRVIIKIGKRFKKKNEINWVKESKRYVVVFS